jgi:hypothetical protein
MKEPKPAPQTERAKREKKETVSIAAGNLSAYGGNFHSDELNATYKFGISDGKLILQSIQSGDSFIHSSQHIDLRPVGKDIFAVDEEGLQFTFARDAKGEVSGFQLDAGRTKGLVFQRN